MTALAISVLHSGHSKLRCERRSCLGIDVQSLTGAPGDEIIRLDYGTDNGQSAGFSSALLALGLFAPGVVGERQDVRVHHDLSNSRIILAIEPAYSGGSDPGVHVTSSVESSEPGQTNNSAAIVKAAPPSATCNRVLGDTAAHAIGPFRGPTPDTERSQPASEFRRRGFACGAEG